MEGINSNNSYHQNGRADTLMMATPTNIYLNSLDTSLGPSGKKYRNPNSSGIKMEIGNSDFKASNKIPNAINMSSKADTSSPFESIDDTQ